MKKIYISTPVDTSNYGNRLQNFAVHRICEKIGLEPVTLAVEYSYVLGCIPKHILLDCISFFHIEKLFQISPRFDALLKAILAWKFTKKHIETQYVMNKKEYDDLSKDGVFVGIGGDQIWAKTWHDRVWFSGFSGVDADKKICFSPSFGSDQLSEEYLYSMVDELKQIEFLAVRESSGASYINHYTGKKANVICDPVVSLTKEEWETYISRSLVRKIKGRFAFCYFLGKINEEQKKWITQYCKDNELQIIDVSIHGVSKRQAVDPLQFVNYINSAALVMTDSFHGLMFSLVMNSPVLLFERKGGEKMNNRINEIVDRYDLDERKFNVFQKNPELNMSFDKINRILKDERDKAHKYYTSFNRDRKECYRAYSLEKNIRLSSSSGGLFFELSKFVLEVGGIVIGCALLDDGTPILKAIDKIEDLHELMGSKYAQAVSNNIYKTVKQILMTGRTVLFCGTPCQCNGMSNYLDVQYENLYFVDIVCHGVPSTGVWRNYYSHISDGLVSIVNFRDKRYGWKEYGLSITSNDVNYYKDRFDDPYLKAFLKNIIIRPSCYKCKAKGNNRLSDITLGDFWGNKFPHDDTGYSFCVLHTDKGKMIFNKIKSNVYSELISIKDATFKNASYWKSVREPLYRRKFFENYRDNRNVIENLDDIKQDSVLSKIIMRIKSIAKRNSFYIKEIIKENDKADKYSCCGCGACANVCPTKAITMSMDSEGFCYPVVNKAKCCNCNKCIAVCHTSMKM
jgi:coenzyme F420-reducing hydrogenase beta subunit